MARGHPRCRLPSSMGAVLVQGLPHVTEEHHRPDCSMGVAGTWAAARGASRCLAGDSTTALASSPGGLRVRAWSCGCGSRRGSWRCSLGYCCPRGSSRERLGCTQVLLPACVVHQVVRLGQAIHASVEGGPVVGCPGHTHVLAWAGAGKPGAWSVRRRWAYAGCCDCPAAGQPGVRQTSAVGSLLGDAGSATQAANVDTRL